MNLHFFEDSLGFYANKTAERIIEIDSDNNIIVNLYTDSKNKSKNIQYITYQSKEYQSLWNQNIERVFIHYYSPLMQHLLKSVDKKVVKIWCFWSADFYGLSKFLPDIYDDFSMKSYIKPNVKWSVYTYFRERILRLLNKRYYIFEDYIKSMSSFDYFASFLLEDYQNVKEFSKSNMKHISWAYLSIDQAIGDNINSSFNNGSKIMIGHSASPSLNHYEVIEKLEKYKVKNTIWMPLSYGDIYYKNLLIKEIKNKNLKIEIEEEFIKLDLYYKKLEEVGFAIFNIRIQQAFGNIIALLWHGVKIFLRKENSVFIGLKKLGFYIFDVDEINADSFIALNITQREHNRKLLKTYFSDENVNNYYRTILKIY